LEIEFVLDAMDYAFTLATPTIWNSDQGSHFTSPLCIERLKANSVQISMDGRGRAFDNIFTERFWRSLKYEEVYLHDYSSPREARVGITRYMGLYNHKRPHEALSYQTPATYYFGRLI
jgi:putative transposase